MMNDGYYKLLFTGLHCIANFFAAQSHTYKHIYPGIVYAFIHI